MKTEPARKARTKPPPLSSRDEELIRMIGKFRFAASLDVAHYLFTPSSLTYVRSLLARLSGGADHQTHTFLCRFQLPMASTGNRERIFCLGSKGRAFLEGELGQSVDWWYRPYKQKFLSFSNVLHHLALTRFCVAAHSWCRKQPDFFRIVQTRLCYELAKQPASVEIAQSGKRETHKVIPDAWILFEKLKNGEHQNWFPILLEIDRGMEHQQKFKRHVRARIEFIKKGGAYSKMFQTDAVMIVYLTTGERPEYRETRRKAMCAWIQEVLSDLHMENWASIFRISSVVFDELYDAALFDEPVWYRPDSPTPVSLFTP